MADIEEEIDLSHFEAKKPQGAQPGKDNEPVIIDLTGEGDVAARKKKLIYIIVIIMLAAAMFVEWYFFYRTPAPDTTATPEQIRELQPKAPAAPVR
jgi:hypothetical protein